LKAFYLRAAQGQRLCVFHSADAAAVGRGAVLYVHPFAEEMNKSRRMAAVQARAFAKAGWDVLLLDLFGCGDSSGDFGDATWDEWQNDVDRAWQWLRSRTTGPVWLWGLRVGALLAVSVVVRAARPCSLLLWQPVLSGHRYVQQFLRFRVMSDAIANSNERSTTRGLLDALAAGHSIEVAGYSLSPKLMLPLDQFEVPRLPPGSVVRCVEVTDPTVAGGAGVSNAPVSAWSADGIDVESFSVSGPHFWQTQDICECPSLIPISVSLLAR